MSPLVIHSAAPPHRLRLLIRLQHLLLLLRSQRHVLPEIALLVRPHVEVDGEGELRHLLAVVEDGVPVVRVVLNFSRGLDGGIE